ncbi:hypothetical protein MLD38_034856 [Melastoma candidum]|uniref:Uncharacterized protein n=1 Tax=Melastoma candidum TaxID=119954 RepID=A0ACB9MDG1_9MYRT|nr:hypothetical protein MLD38_034856 [Melastoma candidum]
MPRVVSLVTTISLRFDSTVLGQFPGTRAEPVKSLIGSRPPNCDGRCKGCGRPCMAVQVPVTPQQFRIQWSRATNSLEYSRGDDISNYKPMTWKCRCGEIYFNP